MIASEDEIYAAGGSEDEEHRDADWWRDATSAANLALDWSFAGGPHPAEVLWRYWSLVRTTRRREFAEYLPVQEPAFWSPEREGVLFRLQLLFPLHPPEQVELSLTETLRCAEERARRRHGWQPRRVAPQIADFFTEETSASTEALDRLLTFLFEQGTEACTVLHRLYALTKWLRSDLVWHMSLRELGEVFNGESRAVQSWRIRRLINGLMKQAGMHGCSAPWQRSATAIERYREAQRGNRNRLRSTRPRRSRLGSTHRQAHRRGAGEVGS